MVWGTETCVKGSWECDCASWEDMKCDSDNKCVPSF